MRKLEVIVIFTGKDYIFVVDSDSKSHSFKMMQVTKWTSEFGYTEINLPEGVNTETPIVINGAYDLLSKMKNSENAE